MSIYICINGAASQLRNTDFKHFSFQHPMFETEQVLHFRLLFISLQTHRHKNVSVELWSAIQTQQQSHTFSLFKCFSGMCHGIFVQHASETVSARIVLQLCNHKTTNNNHNYNMLYVIKWRSRWRAAHLQLTLLSTVQNSTAPTANPSIATHTLFERCSGVCFFFALLSFCFGKRTANVQLSAQSLMPIWLTKTHIFFF